MALLDPRGGARTGNAQGTDALWIQKTGIYTDVTSRGPFQPSFPRTDPVRAVALLAPAPATGSSPKRRVPVARGSRDKSAPCVQAPPRHGWPQATAGTTSSPGGHSGGSWQVRGAGPDPSGPHTPPSHGVLRPNQEPVPQAPGAGSSHLRRGRARTPHSWGGGQPWGEGRL